MLLPMVKIINWPYAITYTVTELRTVEHGVSRVVPGSIAENSILIQDDHIRLGLFNYYNRDGPRVHFNRQAPRDGTSMLSAYMDTYNYALLDGRRLASTTRSKRGSAGSSIIQTQYNGEGHVGEIHNIFSHKQPGVPNSDVTVMVSVAWMKRSTETPLDHNSFIWGEDDL